MNLLYLTFPIILCVWHVNVKFVSVKIIFSLIKKIPIKPNPNIPIITKNKPKTSPRVQKLFIPTMLTKISDGVCHHNLVKRTPKK